MRPRSRADIGVDFDQVDDGALPDGRFNVVSVAQTRATISYMRRGRYIRLLRQLHHLGFIGMRMAKAGFLQPVGADTSDVQTMSPQPISNPIPKSITVRHSV